MTETKGKVVGVNGNMISVKFDGTISLNEVGYVKVEGKSLKSEVIRIRGDIAQMQVYEMTNGISTDYIFNHPQHQISLKDLKNGGMNVPNIILNKENQGYSLFENGKYCVIYSFLNGEEIGNLFKNINKDTSIKIAKEIKNIHKITTGNNNKNKVEVKND